MSSSLLLQILLFFDLITFIPFVALSIISTIYKLTFPSSQLTLIPILISLLILTPTKQFLSNKGNKCQELNILLISVFINLISLFILLYICLWQEYVLLVDVIVGGVYLGFICAEVLVGGYVCLSFHFNSFQ